MTFRFLFGVHVNQPRYRILIENANLTRINDTGSFAFHGVTVHLMAKTSGEVFVRTGTGFEPMLAWIDRCWMQGKKDEVTPPKRQMVRKKRGSKKARDAELTPRAQQNHTFDEVEHLRSLLVREGNPLDMLE